MTFTASQFTPTRYDTAAKKALALNQLTRFLANGCPESGFTEQAYRLLYLHTFGHIAHYSRSGFYSEWFSTPQRRAQWVEYVNRGGAFGLHRVDDDTWGDVERALLNWLSGTGVGNALVRAANEAIEATERAMLVQLQAKYGAS